MEVIRDDKWGRVSGGGDGGGVCGVGGGERRLIAVITVEPAAQRFPCESA